MPITNSDQLLEAITKDLQKAVEKTGDYLVTSIKLSVTQHIYQNPSHPKMYQRLGNDGGFLGSWKAYLDGINNNEISMRVYSDPSPESMKYNPEKYQHGNEFVDRRENLAKYLAEGTDYDFFPAGFDYPRDYWSPILDQLEDGNLDEVFERNLNNMGINFKKI